MHTAEESIYMNIYMNNHLNVSFDQSDSRFQQYTYNVISFTKGLCVGLTKRQQWVYHAESHSLCQIVHNSSPKPHDAYC